MISLMNLHMLCKTANAYIFISITLTSTLTKMVATPLGLVTNLCKHVDINYQDNTETFGESNGAPPALYINTTSLFLVGCLL